jgi:hypothetical protein
VLLAANTVTQAVASPASVKLTFSEKVVLDRVLWHESDTPAGEPDALFLLGFTVGHEQFTNRDSFERVCRLHS